MNDRINTPVKANFLLASVFVLISLVFNQVALAQDDCEVAKEHGQGYSTTVQSVTAVGTNQYNIVISLKHNNCGPPACKKH